MSTALLDINDCELRLWTEHSRVDSPGYVQLAGGQYIFGETARASARLQPRDVNNRFWWQLDTAALQPSLGPARHSADLVHAHLLELHRQAGEPETLLIACPGSMQRQQLSLLLGIGQQCPFRIAGLVDRSALLGSAGRGQYHLELQLHQALLTELERRDGTVSASRSTPLPGCGLLQLLERVADLVAAAFIRQTRFDPRRGAATEQALYDALPALLVALSGHSEHNLELAGHRARLNRGELAGASQPLVTAARQAMGARASGANLLVDPAAASLPGVAEAFPGYVCLPENSIWRAAREHAAQIQGSGESLHLVVSLPCGEAVEPALEHRPRPTHLLRGSVATPLGSGPVTLAEGVLLQLTGGGWQLSASARVNGSEAAAGSTLGSGDLIQVAGEDFSLIEVLAEGS